MGVAIDSTKVGKCYVIALGRSRVGCRLHHKVISTASIFSIIRSLDITHNAIPAD
jgi:hypothetical protein